MWRDEQELAHKINEAVRDGKEVLVIVPVLRLVDIIQPLVFETGVIRRRKGYMEFRNGAKVWFLSAQNFHGARGTQVDDVLIHSACWDWSPRLRMDEILTAVRPAIRT